MRYQISKLNGDDEQALIHLESAISENPSEKSWQNEREQLRQVIQRRRNEAQQGQQESRL